MSQKPSRYETKDMKAVPVKQNSLLANDLNYDIVSEITKDIISDMVKKQDEIFETALRTKAVPPIKGEITKGKLKWRGIRLIQGQYGFMGNTTSQLFQRKTPISPAIYLTTNLGV